MILVHAVRKREWYDVPKTSRFYWSKSLKKDGFIHCSTIENIVEVANNNLCDINEDMLLLCIDTRLLVSEIKWEKRGGSGINFPHIYGKINKNAIVEVVRFQKNECGKYFLPNEMLKYVKYEKSCGAIVLHRFNNDLKVLLINHVSGNHWAFPKGHMELYENEVDTAKREIKEETGLDVVIDSNFRNEVRYSPRRGIIKDVVYFIAHVKDKPFVKMQREEIKDYKWCSIKDARKAITHINNVKILNEAMDYLNNGRQGFWGFLEKLVRQNRIVIDRPKGSKHPKYSDFVYEVDYGYLEDTKSMDGEGIDVFLGSRKDRKITGILCNIDMLKKDSEIKILVGCNKEEKKKILKFMNSSNYMKSILVDRV